MSATTDPVLEETRQALSEASRAVARLARAAQALGKKTPAYVDAARRRFAADGEVPRPPLDELRGSAQESLGGARDLLEEGLRERPAAIAAAALGVGFVLGALLMGGRR